MEDSKLSRKQIAWRCAQDIPNNSYVNLGIGIPTLIGNFTNAEKGIFFHSENGILGVGPEPDIGNEDTDLLNVNGRFVSLVPGGAIVNHADAFVMIRGGHIGISIMGAFQVSENGDLANWITDESSMPAIGGAMDLALGAKKVFVTMEHMTKSGEPRILEKCSYPLTASNVVTRIYTDLSVIDVTNDGLILREIVSGLTVECLMSMTGAPLITEGEIGVLQVPKIT